MVVKRLILRWNGVVVADIDVEAKRRASTAIPSIEGDDSPNREIKEREVRRRDFLVGTLLARHFAPVPGHGRQIPQIQAEAVTDGVAQKHPRRLQGISKDTPFVNAEAEHKNRRRDSWPKEELARPSLPSRATTCQIGGSRRNTAPPL